MDLQSSDEEEGYIGLPPLDASDTDCIPLPEFNYLQVVDQESTLINPSTKSQLLILDLNGTLCSRNSMKKIVYARPHVQDFLDFIFKHFHVMVWSSAQDVGVDRMLHIFGKYRQQLVAMWNRNHFNMISNNTETVKDLQLVWDAMPQFDATNTIVLDDNAEKLAQQPYNLVLMSKFDHYAFNANLDLTDRDLVKAVNYLCILKQQSNVSHFIQQHPFDYKMNWGTAKDLIADRWYVIHSRNRTRPVPNGPKPPSAISTEFPAHLLLTQQTGAKISDEQHQQFKMVMLALQATSDQRRQLEDGELIDVDPFIEKIQQTTLIYDDQDSKNTMRRYTVLDVPPLYGQEDLSHICIIDNPYAEQYAEQFKLDNNIEYVIQAIPKQHLLPKKKKPRHRAKQNGPTPLCTQGEEGDMERDALSMTLDLDPEYFERKLNGGNNSRSVSPKPFTRNEKRKARREKAKNFQQQNSL